MLKMLREERISLLDAIDLAEEQNNLEEAERLQKLLPLDPATANSAKMAWGVEFLQNFKAQGYNFSEIEERYGTNWLTS